MQKFRTAFASILLVAAGFMLAGCESDNHSVSWCYRSDGLTICNDSRCNACYDGSYPYSHRDCDNCRYANDCDNCRR